MSSTLVGSPSGNDFLHFVESLLLSADFLGVEVLLVGQQKTKIEILLMSVPLPEFAVGITVIFGRATFAFTKLMIWRMVLINFFFHVFLYHFFSFFPSLFYIIMGRFNITKTILTKNYIFFLFNKRASQNTSKKILLTSTK